MKTETVKWPDGGYRCDGRPPINLLQLHWMFLPANPYYPHHCGVVIGCVYSIGFDFWQTFGVN
jgi:hypothetical protein